MCSIGANRREPQCRRVCRVDSLLQTEGANMNVMQHRSGPVRGLVLGSCSG